MKKECNAKGITLIALVVTIIVLIILATVSINIVINTGILNKAENASQMHKRSEELERLELIKAVVAIDNAGQVTVDKYIEEAIKEGITTKGDVKDNGDGSKNIVTDNGYDVNIKPDPDNPNNVIITIEGGNGGNGEVVLKIQKVQLTTNTNSIKVDVETKGAEGATYRYYYKTEEGEYTLAHEGPETSYTIGGLKQKTNYTIKVEVEKQNKVVYQEAEGRTEEVPNVTGKIQIGDLEWKDGKASVTVTKTTEDNMKIQYKVGDGEYQEVPAGGKIDNLELGDVVTIRLWDGKNGGGTTTVTVTDTTEPNKATIVLDKTSATTEESVTATVTQSDGQSGINITKCKWVYNKEEGEIGTEETDYTGGTFSTTPQEIPLKGETEGTYYLHVLSIDKAGKKIETISEAVKILDGGVEKHINTTNGLKKVNTKEIYGAEVLGYTSATNLEWQIFYIDEEDDNRVYLIAKDYAVPPVNKATPKPLSGGDPDIPQAFRLTADSNKASLLDGFAGTIPNTSFTQKFLKEYAGASGASHQGLQATNYMLDQKIWAEYKNSDKADYAFGGPTLPLFKASYNDISKDETKIDYQVNGEGYEIKKGTGSWSNVSISGLGDESTQRGLYFKEASLWIASPSAYWQYYMMCTTVHGVVGSIQHTSFSTGFRPIVSLKTSVKFIDNGNGTYTIY